MLLVRFSGWSQWVPGAQYQDCVVRALVDGSELYRPGGVTFEYCLPNAQDSVEALLYGMVVAAPPCRYAHGDGAVAARDPRWLLQTLKWHMSVLRARI
jgi:hypothetical protein